MKCSFCETEIVDGNFVNYTGEMLHEACHAEMCELTDEMNTPDFWEDEAYNDMPEDYFNEAEFENYPHDYYDDDPSVYDGTYSEM